MTQMQFNGVPIHVVPFNNQPCFIAAEVATALEYSDPGKLAKNITGRWADEFTEELDFFKVEGDELAELKLLLGGNLPPSQGEAGDILRAQASTNSVLASLISPYTSHLLLLTRDGVNLACIKARTPRGKDFRRWLASELLPALQDQGYVDLRAETDKDATEHTRIPPQPTGDPWHDLPLRWIAPPERVDVAAANAMLRSVQAFQRLGATTARQAAVDTIRATEMIHGEVDIARRRTAMLRLGLMPRSVVARAIHDGRLLPAAQDADGAHHTYEAAQALLRWARLHQARLYDKHHPARPKPHRGWVGRWDSPRVTTRGVIHIPTSDAIGALKEAFAIGEGAAVRLLAAMFDDGFIVRAEKGRHCARVRIDGDRPRCYSLDVQALHQVTRETGAYAGMGMGYMGMGDAGDDPHLDDDFDDVSDGDMGDDLDDDNDDDNYGADLDE